jgi:putative oxidoreductase
MKKLLSFLFITSPDANLGLFLFRGFLGVGMMTHGIPKLTAGPETWAGLGSVMTGLGAPGPEVFWGFMAAGAEGAGGALLLLGAGTTIASFLIAFTMAVAIFVVHEQDPFAKKELALLYLFGALLFLFKGAGRFSVDALATRQIRGGKETRR